MPSTSNGFLDNLVNGLLGPKGNMADWQHASRLYVDGNLKLAPKQKFLYHVYFKLDPIVRTILPELADVHNLEIGMLVKSADLPKFSANVETRNKYNRKKNVHTAIQYDPINIVFHDDNYGVTTALLEAYYRYYFADAGYGRVPGAYNKAGAGDNTYKGNLANQFKFGLDNDISVPFFQNIQISQLARKSFTTYTIVNPIISSWEHDSLDNSSSETTQNSITVQYEAVHYSRGAVEAGNQGSPTGFGTTEHYDVQPSPISLLGGGTLGIDGLFGAAADLYDYIDKGSNFNSPLQAGLAAFQLIRNLNNLSSESLREQGFQIVENALGETAGIDVSGVSNVVFPGGSNATSTVAVSQGGTNGSLSSTPGATISGAQTSGASVGSSTANSSNVTASDARKAEILVNFNRQELEENPAALEAAAIQLFRVDYLASGQPGGVNSYVESWEQLPSTKKQVYKDKVLL